MTVVGAKWPPGPGKPSTAQVKKYAFQISVGKFWDMSTMVRRGRYTKEHRAKILELTKEHTGVPWLKNKLDELIKLNEGT